MHELQLCFISFCMKITVAHSFSRLKWVPVTSPRCSTRGLASRRGEHAPCARRPSLLRSPHPHLLLRLLSDRSGARLTSLRTCPIHSLPLPRSLSRTQGGSAEHRHCRRRQARGPTNRALSASNRHHQQLHTTSPV